MCPVALFNPLNEQLLLCVQTGKSVTGEEQEEEEILFSFPRATAEEGSC